ncbi:MAG: acetyl-CoA carboxylase biotin carboxylase subunit [Crocinitomicaceae bacterium]
MTKILIANRGEIAIRVMRTAKDLGIATVAIYSEADESALHVKYADEAVLIGPPASNQSYLAIDRIIEACKKTGADAVHPGYGFLSENSEFSQRIADEGLIFIGPSPDAIRVMGDKLVSKQAVRGFDVPLVPGMEEPITNLQEAKRVAEDIGYPIMIKARAGGGGKGMRIVSDPVDFEDQMERAISEAKNSFGDDAVFIEKFISSPKHIEVQVMGDRHGDVIHFFERECSIQRRNQKVIEEAPCALMTSEIRDKITRAAVNVAKACDYYGAGTVEFIADSDLNFYFLEMNTRLQVENPVTEMITGVDLVKEQIRVAEGKPLSYKQEDIKIQGHSIEVRVYAEDPENEFLPDIGKLQVYKPPLGNGVRLDDAFEEGMNIPIYYDPMIAKLVTFGQTRTEAMDRMIRAIQDYCIVGIKTTLPFCNFVMQHKSFRDGTFTTKFVDEHFKAVYLKEEIDESEALAAIAVYLSENTSEQRRKTSIQRHSTSAWKQRSKSR